MPRSTFKASNLIPRLLIHQTGLSIYDTIFVVNNTSPWALITDGTDVGEPAQRQQHSLPGEPGGGSGDMVGISAPSSFQCFVAVVW